MDPNTALDPSFDFAAALVKAMEQEDVIKPSYKLDWPSSSFMSPAQHVAATNPSDTGNTFSDSLFPLDQATTAPSSAAASPPPPSSTLMDPSLSLMHAPASPPPSATGSASTSTTNNGQNMDKQQQQQYGDMNTWQFPSASDYTTTSNNMFLPPSPPDESPMSAAAAAMAAQQATQFPPWFGMQFPGATLNETSPSSVGAATSAQPHMMNPLMCYMPSAFQQHQQHHQAHPTANNATTAATAANGATNASSTNATRNSRRRSAPARPYRRRNSSHPSVASVVSLSAHEPVAHTINGVEHITFLYSHDRLVKEYTVRTDVDNCPLDDIPGDFRMMNAIYPRANVDKEDYDGNRWEYETSCNQLGWKLCWLNQDQLCGRRGLIQRAVDSYRNRHAHMRSRRVTRQEKVANGTLRRRRAKKC
ncbi:hypothetical protein O0I10_006753 [Lichtheimia ornata]|uniref:DUF8032 domain-containing protein n=1 Tax=Lichtheimia ornata TaxID=688661 RepID=A0AAD7V2S0_9FUNG|nr:uncharacterized protein O0I10_006753 [Lichtheimia ornata]KAJ8657451.1 hypothetical protein O0I10_006753 [Lichtheimia ornata]